MGNKIFVFGGIDYKGSCYNDLRMIDIGYYMNRDDITVGEGKLYSKLYGILLHHSQLHTIFVNFLNRCIIRLLL